MLSAMAFCVVLGLFSCAGNPVQPNGEPRTTGPSLDTWLEDTLIPYLLQQLGQHPRFKGQPVLLVSMHAADVQSHIDDLTEQIREKIMDSLLKAPGLDLSWRPLIRSWKHQPGLEDVSCGDDPKIHYYIGIDCRLTRVEGRLQVKVRSLNLAEQKWVSGFGRSWEGKPTAAQLAALNRAQPDEYLRGQRPLPFSNRQPDLLAAYLARNLSCLLRQAEADNLVVYMEDAPANTPGVFQTALNLVGNYLARFREVEVSDDPNRANVTVVTAIHLIHQNLYQIWVSARDRHGKKYLPGAETEAYVVMDAQTPTMMADTLTDISTQPAPRLQQSGITPALISSLDVITPLNPVSCASATPWRSGSRRLEAHEHLSSGDCLAVEMSLSTAVYVFLVGQDVAGELTRMFPSDCPGFSTVEDLIEPGNPFQFPPQSDPEAGVLTLNGSSGMERVYAIAITAPDVAQRFANRLDELQGLCKPGTNFPDKLPAGNTRRPHERIQQWQGYLNRFAAQYPDRVQWREIRFWHSL